MKETKSSSIIVQISVQSDKRLFTKQENERIRQEIDDAVSAIIDKWLEGQSTATSRVEVSHQRSREKGGKVSAESILDILKAMVSADQDEDIVDKAAEPFTDRPGTITRELREADVPKLMLDRAEAGLLVIDRYGATAGCDCENCEQQRSEHNNLPSLIFALECIAKEHPSLKYLGVYELGEDAFADVVQRDSGLSLLRYMKLNPAWDTDGELLYYKPDAEPSHS